MHIYRNTNSDHLDNISLFSIFITVMISLSPLILNSVESTIVQEITNVSEDNNAKSYLKKSYGQQIMTPEIALKNLIDGNERYIQDKLIHPNRSAERRESLSNSQYPFAIVLGCSDSRVSPEIVFDQGVGDVFVVRVAGNVVGPIELASIEFSAESLNSSIILVLGHENCGAVQAVLAHNTKNIEPIAIKIEAALENKVNLADNPLENAIKNNVLSVVEQLRNTEVLSSLIAQKKLLVVGGYYNLSSGKVELCCDLPRKNQGTSHVN